MIQQHHRIWTALAATLALCASAASPSFASIGFIPSAPASHQSPASTTVCSEVCGGAGYGSDAPAAANGATLPHDPRPRSIATVSRVDVSPTHPTRVRGTAHGGGFDGGDAAVGAGATIALLLAVAGGLHATAKRRGRRPAEPHASAAG